METSILHILNGDGMLEQMKALELPGKKVVWRELLCEGATDYKVGSESFITQRQQFLKKYYDIPTEVYEKRFLAELRKLENAKKVDEINLWFEFDLYDHINMMALINFLLALDTEAPVFLVCSKRLSGDSKGSKGLARLNSKQLLNHYNNRINLTLEDLEYASLIWNRYNSFDHKKLIPEIKTPSNFEYLSSCLRAHLQRFPNLKTGLNTMETNVLKLIDTNRIMSQNQLLGYALEFQGYYGYSFDQMLRLINEISAFYTQNDGAQFVLNEKGQAVMDNSQNFYPEVKNDLSYGGVGKYDFLYDPETHNLMKL